MIMLNRNCKTSFVKPEYLKKAQSANPHLYDIGCYNDNLALMLAPESDETICLAQESRSKLSDIIKPFDYKNLNNLYDLFVHRREKSAEQKEYYYVDHMNAILNMYTTLDEHSDLACNYLETLEKCECLENELSKRTENVNNKPFNELSKRFSELEQHSINLELALQQSHEQIKHDKVWKQKESSSFRELNDKFFEIQDFKALLQAKNIAISELKKLIDKIKGKYVETKFEKPSKDFSKSRSVTRNILSKDFSKPVTAQILPQKENVVQKNTNVIAPGMYKMNTKIIQPRTPQLPQDIRKTNKRVSFSTGVILTTSISRPQLKSNRLEDRVLHNNSQGKKQELVEIILFIVDFGCSKHMMGNLKLLSNFLEKFLGMVKFGNDQFAPILGYGDLVQGNITIKRVYYNDIVIGLPKLKFVKDHLCSSCELGKAKRKSFKTKTTPSSKRQLQHLHMDLCGPMRVECINGKTYVILIVDDYSRYTWTHFLRSKDETPEVLIDFLRLIQRGLHAQVRTVRNDKDTKFLNKTLHEYFFQEGIEHQTSVARTPVQNDVFERRNCTLVEATRTMLIVAKVSLFFWAEAIATAVLLKTVHSDGKNLNKMKEKMALDHVSSDPAPQYPTTALEHGSLSPASQSQVNVPQAAESVTTSLIELDMLFNPMFDEYFNGDTTVVSKSSVVPTTDASDKRHQQNTASSSSITIAVDLSSLTIKTTPEPTIQAPTQAPTVTATENKGQAEVHVENAHVDEEEFINIFSTSVWGVILSKC
ncbi:retrovirus-related pol polyprotein from transposon TNT 1-94 [Tanacetum coccineum]|uniref:Retrovirus-related pol polyprotein from transposon TNT 1-94 n=1 Tax=Tanacetum coccineum TaxID=301880 RepID=A0ABQ5HB36_9ASTR